MVPGLGVDIVELEQMKDILSRSGEIFISRVYGPQERIYSHGLEDPTAYYASSFAAKEALFKALVLDWEEGIDLRDIETLRGTSGEPRICLHGPAAEAARRKGFTHFQISISYGMSCALATVIAL
ncbi:MAG: holo-ACP synthase [Spirochaetota bacterium]